MDTGPDAAGLDGNWLTGLAFSAFPLREKQSQRTVELAPNQNRQQRRDLAATQNEYPRQESNL